MTQPANIVLYDSALSPFCRKVRMVLELKGVEFKSISNPSLRELGHLNDRAEIPILLHGDLVVVNSSDIVAYLDHAFPKDPVYPSHPAKRVLARRWERVADTLVDAIVTDLAIWNWANIGSMPEGLRAAGQRDIGEIYDELERDIGEQSFICGALSIADLALFPHLAAAWHLDLRCSSAHHPGVTAWVKRMRDVPVCRKDLERVRAWWAKFRSGEATGSKLDRERVNWGTHRLEWLLANGHAEWFARQVQNDRVLWSVGPSRNGRERPVDAR